MNTRPILAPLVFALLALVCHQARAQLSPERLYYGVNQAINVRVTTPDNIGIDTAILLQRPDGTTIKVAGAAPGIVNLATTIPSAPGYIGTFDAPGIAVLTAYGVDQATAAGYTLVLHVALWVPITALGAYYLAREGIKWSDSLRDEAE